MENYIPSDCIFNGKLPELYCIFKVHRLHPESTGTGCIRIYVDIEHDIIYNHLSYQKALDLTYSIKEYESLMKAGLLIDNLKMHYLRSESISRGIDEYFH